MPSDKAAYLATHYLNTDTKPPSKKRKRKHATTTAPSGLLIQDDDDTAWGTTTPQNDDDHDPDAPTTVIAGTSADFRRSKKSAWKPLSTGNSATAAPSDTDTTLANAIIASAAADQAAAAREADGDEILPSLPPPSSNEPIMSNGTLPGLQPASAITAQLRARQAAEAAELAALEAERKRAALDPSSITAAGEPEIVLRDATGRRVDASMRRAELRRQAAEAEKAAEAKVRLLKGEVQQAEARRRKEELQDAKLMTVARGKDDEVMNREMKETQRWNDPMAQFLAADEGTSRRKKGRPVYKGAAAPNRYGILPGYRWDGVDRGNGFEAERFKAFNRARRNKELDYAWQMDE